MATERAEENVQGQAEEVQEEVTSEVEKVEMTKEEYETSLQKEADRRVSQALAKREAELQKKFEQQIADARREAEELAKLSESERLKAEQEKEREKLKQDRANFERERLLLQAEKELVAKGLPVDMAAFVLADTAEDTLERIGVLEAAFRAGIDGAVQDRLKGTAPKAGSSPKPIKYTREQVESMSKEEVDANIDAIMESMSGWK